MGIYYDHGVEYHICRENKEHIVLVDIKGLDHRLRESKWFQSKSKDWFINKSYDKLLILDVDFDIKLNQMELGNLETYLTMYPSATHGWYDVNKMYTTYNW